MARGTDAPPEPLRVLLISATPVTGGDHDVDAPRAGSQRPGEHPIPRDRHAAPLGLPGSRPARSGRLPVRRAVGVDIGGGADDRLRDKSSSFLRE